MVWLGVLSGLFYALEGRSRWFHTPAHLPLNRSCRRNLAMCCWAGLALFVRAANTTTDSLEPADSSSSSTAFSGTVVFSVLGRRFSGG